LSAAVPIDGQRRQLDIGKQRTAATFGLSRSTPSELSLPEQQDAEQGDIAPLTTATVGRANIGLTSTDVAALDVNDSNYHVFAGTHP
jgi:hypothetical protein